MKSQYRFYVERELVSGCCFIAGPSLAYQLGRVLRLAGGDTVSLFGTNGREFLATVDFEGRDVTLTPFRDVTVPREPAVRLTLLLALSKGDKPETQVQKCTELGAAAFVFAPSRRSVARPRDTEARVKRLRRIACEAAEQCGRVTVPDISFGELCDTDTAPYDLKLVCSGPSGRPVPRRPEAGAVIAAVGPEGGFCGEELEYFAKRGFEEISLGGLTLRSETAAAAVCACLLI